MKEISGENSRKKRKSELPEKEQSENYGSTERKIRSKSFIQQVSGDTGHKQDKSDFPFDAGTALAETMLQDISPCGYFALDRDSTICSLNLNGARMLGSERHSLLNKSFRQFVSVDSLGRFNEFITRVFSSDSKQVCIVELKPRVNAISFMHLTGIMTSAGSKCIISAADITDSKIEEEELRISNRFLWFAGETARFGVWSIETANYKVSLSEEIMSIFEFPAGFYPSIDKIYTYFASGSNEVLADMLKECMEKGTEYDEILEAFTYTGRKIWIRTTGEAVREANGRITKVYGFLQDITRLHKDSEEISRINERLKLALESSSAGTWDWDMVNDKFYLSDNIREIFRSGNSTIRGLPAWQSALHPDDAERAREDIEMAIRDRVSYKSDYRVLQPDGTIRWVRSIGKAIYEDEKPVRMVGLCMDITESKIAEREINDLNANLEARIAQRTRELAEINERLKREIEEHKKTERGLNDARIEAEKANKAKTEFIASMSHEIRTPLNAILGYSELLGSSMNESFQKEYLEAIKNGGRTLLTLFNDILDLAKIEAGKVQLEMDYIDIAPFFTEFEKIFAYRLSEKGLKYTCELGEDLPAYLYIDGARLRQIVLNIVGNAIKFTNQGEVKLKVYSRNHDVVIISEEKQENVLDLVIEVRDTGIGIQAEHQREIFGSFFQVQSKTAQSGAGLGLPIALRLTRLMHGKIALRSTPGAGSTFTIKIPHVPYQKFHHNLKDDLKTHQPDLIFEKATIIVVDDVEGNCRHIKDLLEGTGLTVFEAENGLEALELIKIAIPDLVITDIIMPGLDGFGLVEKIKSDEKLRHIPVIAYTASIVKEQRDKIVRSEFSDLLVKPVHVAELYYVLMNFLKYTSLSADDNR